MNTLPSKSYFGTGDIQVPEPPPRDKEELLAEALANGELDTPGKLKKFAARIGWDLDYLYAKRMTKTIEKKVVELVKRRALYAAANALPYQEELAKTDVTAFKTLLQVGKVLEPGGVRVENTISIDRRDGGDNEAAVRFNEVFMERLTGTVKGRLALVKGPEMHDPVPEEPPQTPEEAVVGAEPEDLEEMAPLVAPKPPSDP
jgi:hypothetical protein